MIKFVCIYLVLVATVVCQTNNPTSIEEVKVQQLEDLYYLNLLNNPKTNIKLSGRILFEADQFGSTKRIVSYPSVKIGF